MTTELRADEAERHEMLEVNLAQQKFYEQPHAARGSIMTRVWAHARNSMMAVRREAKITSSVHVLHRQWMGDLTGKRVLDLGCGWGNTLSLEIAGACGYYLGIDLSSSAIGRLSAKLSEAGLPHAEARCLDFLSPDFPSQPFDVVYAYSVLHHFRHFDTFLRLLHERLVPGGIVLSVDPLNTWLPMRLARRAWRPFESDAGWEHPFGFDSFHQIRQHFEVVAVQGVMGHAKLAVPLAAIPFCGGIARRAATRLHQMDLRAANRMGPGLWRCMQVALCLRRPADDVS